MRSIDKFNNFTEKGRKQIDQICLTAAKVFGQNGYLSATLSDVALAAGTTKGGIFHYFSTKEELLFLIVHRYMNNSLKGLEKKLSAVKSPREKLYTFISHHIHNYVEHQNESRLALLERSNLPRESLEVIKEGERQYETILRSIVDGVVKEKGENLDSVRLISFSLLGMCTFPYMWFDPEGQSTPHQLIETIFKIFCGNLKIDQS
ncbi:putative TetR-family transcriptional regulator [Desulfosarcina cetonica]|nr:putative TetR-family transcriptional regulator [Desulfosarcina cetonica]